VLEIDIAFDWKYYDVNENLLRKKEVWNELVTKRLKAMKELSEHEFSLSSTKRMLAETL
jgi:hypothetical protein